MNGIRKHGPYIPLRVEMKECAGGMINFAKFDGGWQRHGAYPIKNKKRPTN